MTSITGEGLNERQRVLIGIASTCMLLSTIAIALRLVVRWSSSAILWWDDWIAILALVWVLEALSQCLEAYNMLRSRLSHGSRTFLQ